MRAYLSKTRTAGGSIKSSTPAEMLGRGPRPGVERSGTQDDRGKRTERAERAIAQKQRFTNGREASVCAPTILGFRSAPPQALCWRLLRRLERQTESLSHDSYVTTPIQFICRILAPLRCRAQQAADTFTPPYRDHNRAQLCRFLHPHWQVVALSAGSDPGLRGGVDWPFLHREEQAGHVSVSAVVVHWRLQNDLDDVDRQNERRG